MKRTTNNCDETYMTSRNELIRVFTEINDDGDMARFFDEIFTPKERADLVMRWQLLKELHAGEPQRAIAARHRISLCKITRGSRILKQEDSVTRILLERFAEA